MGGGRCGRGGRGKRGDRRGMRWGWEVKGGMRGGKCFGEEISILIEFCYL